MGKQLFPSVWLGDFRSRNEFLKRSVELQSAHGVFDWIDDRLLYSRHPMEFHAYCSACEKVTKMRVDWALGGAGGRGSMNPAWTETGMCPACRLNSRMRALIDFIRKRIGLDGMRNVYVAEQKTPAYGKLKRMFPKVTGSEFLGEHYRSGEVYTHMGMSLRHEDLTCLSFSDGEFDLAITQDVFEHVPNYRKAFCEMRRVLAPGGRLVFTIPFFYDLEKTRIRASLGSEGVVHHLPPEIHGNPVSNEGALCFQNFGWDILDDLRSAGFSDAFAALYWGPWQGHLGLYFFVFHAECPDA